MCNRSWQMRTRGPVVPCGDGDDCTVCGRVEARHQQALRQLEREIETATRDGRRFVAVGVYIQVPNTTAPGFEAFVRRELHVDSCDKLAIAHACALLLDTQENVAWHVESQCLLPFVQARLQELAEGLLGMRLKVHRLTTQLECTPRGEFKFKWCLMYSQAMALGLVDALVSPPVHPLQRAERAYLGAVWTIMDAFMRRRVRQARSLPRVAGLADDLVARLTTMLA